MAQQQQYQQQQPQHPYGQYSHQQQPQHPYEHQQQLPQQYTQATLPQQPHQAHAYTSPNAMSNEKPQMQHQPHSHDGHTPAAPGTSRKWAFGLFDCFSPLDTCCISFWCPCYLFGKTYERNKTGEKDPSGFNGMCCAYLATLYCGCAPILQCMQRGNTREKHNIDGGLFGDFCTSCCCACCALIQEEKESVVRVTGVDPVSGAVYQPVGQMTYS